jgi:hypothetical protein
MKCECKDTGCLQLHRINLNVWRQSGAWHVGVLCVETHAFPLQHCVWYLIFAYCIACAASIATCVLCAVLHALPCAVPRAACFDTFSACCATCAASTALCVQCAVMHALPLPLCVWSLSVVPHVLLNSTVCAVCSDACTAFTALRVVAACCATCAASTATCVQCAVMHALPVVVLQWSLPTVLQFIACSGTVCGLCLQCCKFIACSNSVSGFYV